MDPANLSTDSGRHRCVAPMYRLLQSLPLPIEPEAIDRYHRYHP